jgi:hypothetical protein
MSQIEHEAAVSEFLRKTGITRCPTACVGITQAQVAHADQIALQAYTETKEAARKAKLVNHWRRRITGISIPVAHSGRLAAV